MIVYCLANQKGGVGKTSSSAALAAARSELGERVLIVDLDPHAGLTNAFGLDPKSFEKTTYSVLLGHCPITDAIIPTKLPGLDLLPANKDLAGAEPELIGELGWDRVLADALQPLAGTYAKVFVDCPPSLGVLTVNALVAASVVIVPLQCEYLAMKGLQQLQEIIEKVKRKANPNLQVRILRTMYDPRTLHSREVSDEILERFNDQVFPPIVHRTIKFADSTVAGEPITTYASSSQAAQAYRDIAQEI
jgi:chromosome partitioning protein